MKKTSGTGVNALLINFLICALLVGSSFTLSFFFRDKRIDAVSYVGMEIFSPAGKVVSRIVVSTINVFRGVGDIAVVRKENERLKKEIRTVSKEKEELSETLVKYPHIKDVLEYSKRQTRYKLLYSNIVAWDPSNWYNSIIIDRGARDGVRIGMPVISYQHKNAGLVGRVIEVAPSVSKVLLIIDKNSGIAGVVHRSRYRGVVNGISESYCRMEYLAQDADVKKDDWIVTAGGTSFFPSGIKIGRVEKVDWAGTLKTARVKPIINFGKLEDALVVTSALAKEMEKIKN